MYKYQLQPYQGSASRYRCPECNHRTKSFVRYINTQTGEQLAPQVGRCGRLDKCGYHYTPKSFFEQAGSYRPRTCRLNRKSPKPQPPLCKTANYIHPDMVNNSFKSYRENCFVQYLINRFGFDTADAMIGRYRIGISKHWPGATVFWQLDTQGYVRTGKIMLYNAQTGKRVKQPFNHITWAHKVIMSNLQPAVGRITSGCQPVTANFNLNQCLFGEHLLAAQPHKPVAIAESEKTAIMASFLMPEFVWLASGSLDGLNADKCKPLKGRQVMLFPDVNAYNKWKIKAQQLHTAMPDTLFLVSDALERAATGADRQAGIDLGDVMG